MLATVKDLTERVLRWTRGAIRTDAWLREQGALWARRYFSESQQRVAAIVAEILVAQVGVGFDALTPRSQFIEDLAMDDLEPTQVVLALEEEFGFSIPDCDCERLATVAELVSYLDGRVRSAEPA